jgi:hypothetical protein
MSLVFLDRCGDCFMKTPCSARWRLSSDRCSELVPRLLDSWEGFSLIASTRRAKSAGQYPVLV